MMHQVLYIVQLPNEDDMHIIWHLVHYDMPCSLVSSAFYTIPIFPY